MTEEPRLEERIVEVLGDAPDDTASVETIRGLLKTETGIRPATEDVRQKADELVEQGRVGVVSSESGDRRYRLDDTNY